MQAKAFPDAGGNLLTRLAAVVAHEGVEDDREGKGFAFGDLGGEHAVAVLAPPELDSLVLLVALAVAGNMQPTAIEAALALVAD